MKQKIITIPNPILRQKSKPVKKIDKKLLSLIQDMQDTLCLQKKPQGAGLSAPQIGKSYRVCLVFSKKDKKAIIMVNPEIIWKSSKFPEKEPFYEGCLSVPKIWGVVKRPKEIKVRYLNPQKKVIAKFTGFTSIVVQHEIDHLDGILFIDKVLAQNGKLYQVERNKEGKEEMVEIEL